MLIVHFKPLFKLSQYIIGDDVSVFKLAFTVYARVSLRRIVRNVPAFQQVFTESLQPCQVIIPRSYRVISIDEYVIEKLSDNLTVKLVTVKQLMFSSFFHFFSMCKRLM